MSDDPREILAEAGVECAELNAVWSSYLSETDHGYYAILALARLVAEYAPGYEQGYADGESSGYADFDAALDCIVSDGFEVTPSSVAELVAKYKWQRDQVIKDMHQASWVIGPRTGVSAAVHITAQLDDLDHRWEERGHPAP